MQVAVNNRKIELDYNTAVAIQYDNGTEYVDFTLDRTQYNEDLSNLTPLFLYENKAGGFIDSATKTVTDTTIVIRWLIGKHITHVSGPLKFMLVLANCENIKNWETATKIWQTEKAECTIPPSILATGKFDPESPLVAKLIALAAQIDKTIGNANAIISEITNIKDETVKASQEAKDVVANFTGEDVHFTDGKTFQEKYESGELNGPQGPKGDMPTMTVGENGNWFASGVDTGTKAQGPQGPPGTGVEEMQVALEGKQDKTDNTLQTTTKTITGAINELQAVYTSDLTTFLSIMNGGAS
ncbi:MAG: hypothetical protein RR961_06265 [Eubacterium sp.]